MKKITLLHGDCLDKLKELKDNSIDSIVTDPPYGLSFMGKKWDYDVPSVDIWKECLRVLKPGGHLLSFAGSRTYHRMAVRIEDAGFEIRDQIMWIYGSGFPKSHNIGKGVDKIEGNEAESKIYHNEGDTRAVKNSGNGNSPICKKCNTSSWIVDKKYCKAEDGICINPERYDANNKWDGWGTALKPAHEPIVMARKPFKGTVVDNTLEWGTGGINIDGTRIGHTEEIKVSKAQTGGNKVFGQGGRKTDTTDLKPEGRWPANVMFDEEAGKVLDEQSGVSKSCKRSSKYNKPTQHTNTYTPAESDYRDDNTYGDVGGASRFFYCPKASKKDKGDNIHPTVKPTELMGYLIRLVTPKDGLILDPFMGSGSTGKAAVIEEMRFVGIEREKEYFDIAEQRVMDEADKRQYW